MNLQVTELKIGKVAAAEINWNGAEIKASLNVALEDYRNMVVTEETLKGSKKVMADLNKQAKVLDDFRKSTVKKLNPDIKQFESEAKELVSMIKEARTTINDQVETFIIKQREEKKELVKCAINSVLEENKLLGIELKEKYLVQIELKDQYLNSSMTINKVTEDLKVQFNSLLQDQNMEQQKIDTIKVIVDAFNGKLTFKFTANEFDYLLDNDIATISSVVNEKVQNRLAEQEAELERIKKEQEAAIEQAKKEAEEKAAREAQAEADRVEREKLEAERKHQEELRQIEIAKQEAIDKAEAEKQAVLFATEEALQSVEAITPVEHSEDEGNDLTMIELNFSVLETPDRLETLKNFLDQYDYQYCIEGE